MSLVDRALVCKTLVCLLQGLEGYHTTIELRNENSVTGTIESVDARMNISLTNATFNTLAGNKTHFDKFYIRGIQIRYVHIPDDVDVKNTITKRIKQEQNIGKKGKFEKRTKTDQYSKKVGQKFEEAKRALGVDRNMQHRGRGKMVVRKDSH